MGFLSRNKAAPAHTPPTGSHHHNNTTKTSRFGGFGGKMGGGRRNRGSRGSRAPMEAYSMHRKPTFGQWLKHTALDIITMAIMGAIGLGVYFADPAPSRSFAITFSDGEVVFPEFAAPMRKEIIPIWAAAMLAALVPITIFLICQIRIRSFWDVNNATIGLLYSLIGAAVFQVFVKWLIGGLRPHFLDVCKPDPTLLLNGAEGQGNGFREIYFQRDICTGDKKEINDALESMPSGHTTAAFAGFVFLYLYLNAKLKVFSNYHPAMWKLIAIYAPLLGACLIGGALTIDEYHNWYDVFAGAVIGTVFAFSSYRMVYAAIWDFRYNHIPLNRGSPFMYQDAMGVEGGMAVFTRKGIWGHKGHGGLGMSKEGAAAGAAAGGVHHGVGHHGVGHDGVGNNGGLTGSHGHHGVGHNDGLTGTHGHHGVGHNDGLTGTHGHHGVGHNDGLTGTHAHHGVAHNDGLTGSHGHHGVGHNDGLHNDHHAMGRDSIPRRPVGAHTEGDNIV